MLQAHRTMATVEPDGTLRLDDLPFEPGDRLEVILLATPARGGNFYPVGGLTLPQFSTSEVLDAENWNVIGQSRW